MGALCTTGRSIADWLTELVGRRIGLAVSDSDLQNSANAWGYGDYFPSLTTEPFRVRAETVEFLTYSALDYFGSYGAWRGQMPLARAASILRGGARTQASGFAGVLEEEFSESVEAVRLLWESTGSPALDSYDSIETWRPHRYKLDQIDRRSLIYAAREIGIEDAMSALIAEVENRKKLRFFDGFRECEWIDVLALAELFNSESTLASCGRFIDQRFINFLATNYEEVGLINWRKFEALVAEYFHRSGFEVDLGPGRGDDGVDIRLWESGTDRDPSTLVIVQCKRERRKIEKVVVKALAADVRWNGATKGLLVATTDWSPGARSVARTRNYPVEEVNSDAVRAWVQAMMMAGVGTTQEGRASAPYATRRARRTRSRPQGAP